MQLKKKIRNRPISITFLLLQKNDNDKTTILILLWSLLVENE